MALEKPYRNIPGTTVFDADMSRKGYHLNQFCMSLMKEANRERFLADEKAYVSEWPLSAVQEKAVLERDYNTCIAHGANIYFLAKLFYTDKTPFERGVSTMTNMSPEEYRQMMLDGGRPIEGNRYIGE